MDETVVGKLYRKYTSKKFWIGLIKYGAVWTYFLHAGTASIYYIYNTIYLEQGVQPDVFSSVSLVVLVIIGSVVLTRRVLDS